MQESFIKAFLVATETPGLSVLTPNTGVPVTVLPRGAALVKGPCEKMNLGALVRVFGPQTSRPSWLLACCLSVCWLFPALGLGMAQKPEVSYPAKRVLGTEHGVVGEVCAFGTLASGGEGALGSLEPPPGSWRPAQLCLLFQPGGGGGRGERDEPPLHTPDVSSPAEPASSEKRAVGRCLAGFHSPLGSLSLAGFHGRECWGDASVCVFSLKKHRNRNLFYIWGQPQASQSGQDGAAGKSAAGGGAGARLTAHLRGRDRQPTVQGVLGRWGPSGWGWGGGRVIFQRCWIVPLGAFLVLSGFSGSS